MKFYLGIAAFMVASGAMAQEAPKEPDWSVVKAKAEARLTRDAIDPKSAQIDWLSGWRPGEGRSGNLGLASKKYAGWIGCANVDLRNRMGGYGGPRLYSVIYTDDGEVRLLNSNYACYSKATYTPLQPAFREPVATGGVDVADQLTKLATLHDKGVLTDAEFQAQKVKLLAR